MTLRQLLIIGTFAWCAAIAATPFLASLGGTGAQSASLSYEFFSRVCHQLDSRSFHIAGYKFAVCIRCFSIYLSFFTGVVLYPSIFRTKIAAMSSRIVLVSALLPMAIDVVLSVLRISESTVTTRVATGSIFGFALSLLLVPVVEEIAENYFPKVQNNSQSVNLAGLHSLDKLHNLQPASNNRNLSNR